jgi:hypothetical protein
VRGYSKLKGILGDFARSQVLSYASAAGDVFEALKKQRIRIGTMDLRIAAIALASGMTVLTRNRADFGRVPNLAVEGWTIRLGRLRVVGRLCNVGPGVRSSGSGCIGSLPGDLLITPSGRIQHAPVNGKPVKPVESEVLLAATGWLGAATGQAVGPAAWPH